MFHVLSTMFHVLSTMFHVLSNSFRERCDNALYALACDDECNAHYGLKPSTIFRVRIALAAFFSPLNSGEIFHA